MQRLGSAMTGIINGGEQQVNAAIERVRMIMCWCVWALTWVVLYGCVFLYVFEAGGGCDRGGGDDVLANLAERIPREHARQVCARSAISLTNTCDSTSVLTSAVDACTRVYAHICVMDMRYDA